MIDTNSEGYKKYVKEEKAKARNQFIKEEGKRLGKVSNKNYEGVNNLINKYGSKRMSYKKSNPLKSLLKSKQQTVHVSGNKNGEHINLMRARW